MSSTCIHDASFIWVVLTPWRFLDSWKAGDYPSSFDNLHRYFDYTMHNRDRTFYQYALLNLAILQADFGCYHEAVAAMHETISTARENKDMACLNYSLSWLYHFGKAHPEELGEVQRSGVLGTEKEALAFLKAKAKETSMWSLLSTSLLSEAKSALASVSSLLELHQRVDFGRANPFDVGRQHTGSIRKYHQGVASQRHKIHHERNGQPVDDAGFNLW